MGQGAATSTDGQFYNSAPQFTPAGGYRPSRSSLMDFFPGNAEEEREVNPIEVSPLASTSHVSVMLPASTLRRVAGIDAIQEKCTQESAARDWAVNSILEVLSMSRCRWYIGYVLQVHPGEYDSQMLTVRFWDENNEAKQKNISRSDSSLLCHLGVHTTGQLPPGFKSQASQSRPGSSAFLDTATGMKYSSPEIAWNVHFQRLRDGPPMTAPEVEVGAPVPRRSPAAIAAGLTEDASPIAKRPQTVSCLAEPAAAPSSPMTREQQARADWEAQVAAQMDAPSRAAKMDAAAVARASEADAKAQRAANQPARACPTFSPDKSTEVRQSQRGAKQPPRACPTFSPSHLDDLVSFPSAPTPRNAASTSGKLFLDELIVGAGTFHPGQPAILEQLQRKLGCNSREVIAIEDRNGGVRGGLNEGVWYLDDLVLKLVQAGRRCAALPSETENFVKLSHERPDVFLDPSMSLPVAVFKCRGPSRERRYDLIVMKIVPGTMLATLIALRWHANQQASIWHVLARVGAYLAAFHAKYGKSMCHGDFHPSNVFYDEASDTVSLIDVGSLGLPSSETDAEHFEKSLRLLAKNYGQLLEIEGIRSFRSGYASMNSG